MRKFQDHKAAFVGALIFPAVSCAVAGVYVARNNWFDLRDLWVFALWSCLLVIPGYLALFLFDRLTKNWRPALAYLVGVFLGGLSGALATVLVAAILGPWIGAFGFPVFLCWLAGALSSFVSIVLVRRPASWAAAFSSLGIPLFGVYCTLHIMFARPPDILIQFKPDVSSKQIQTIWTEVLSTSHPSGRGDILIDGVRNVSAFDSDTEARIRVGFHPGTSEARRTEVVARVLKSPLVAKVSDLEANASNKFSARSLAPR